VREISHLTWLAACLCAKPERRLAPHMSEHDVVQKTTTPATVASLRADLESLGVQSGSTLLVHSSLSALGWICGGAVAVIQALQETLCPEGTLVMPAFTGGMTDPKNWQHPPVPEDWKDTIRSETPAFDPLRTPTRNMGRIAETFRTWPDVVRSLHPHCSFTAWGRHAVDLTREHPLECGLGKNSPLERIYDLEGWVLLLGVGYGNNTSLHLAECRGEYANKEYENNGGPMLVDGERQWVQIRDLVLDADDFPQIGEAFERESGVARIGSVGIGVGRLMPQRELVDFAQQWIEQNR